MPKIADGYAATELVENAIRSRNIDRARKSLLWFTKTTKENYRQSWHHIMICQYLRRWMAGEFQNLIISMPPRHGKSEIASIRLPAFILGQKPDARIIATSYSDSLASKNNRAVQRVIDSDMYRRIFPNTQLADSNNRSVGPRPIRNSDEFEIVGHQGIYRSAGVGGGITGMGADYFIIDDPIKNDKEADSETYREAIWEWWTATAFTRLEENSRALLIMTRWHEDDLAGRLLKAAKDDPLALQWKELRLDAIREELANPEDPRAIGEALWPGKYNEQRLATIKTTLGPRWWNALYQQRPTALEGGIIKKKWIKYYGGPSETKTPPVFHKMIQSWDLTSKKTQTGSYVCGQVWGVYAKQFYLLDQFRERVGFVDACKAIKAMTAKWPRARRKLIEDKANGEATVDSLKREQITGLVLVSPGGSKEERLSAVSTEYESGDVFYPHPSIAPWVNTNVDEIVKFPNTAHNDTVDTSSQALNDLAGGESVLDKLTRTT